MSQGSTNAAPSGPGRRTAGRLAGAGAELGATLAKAALAVAVFLSVTGGYARLREGRAGVDPATQPLPNEVRSACALWFVGSSSMSRWASLERDMHPWVSHNRAIAGATLSELSGRFAIERAPAAPRALVFYAGENDLAYGVPADAVLAEFQRFLERKTASMGTVPVLFVSVKPSPTRLKFRPAQARFNAAVRRLADARADLHYVDIVPDLFRGGRLGPYYEADGIHMNDQGYRIWARAVRRALRDDLPADLVRACDGNG